MGRTNGTQQTVKPRAMREGEVMGAYMDFDRTADKTWSAAEYLVRFGLFISERTAALGAEDGTSGQAELKGRPGAAPGEERDIRERADGCSPSAANGNTTLA